MDIVRLRASLVACIGCALWSAVYVEQSYGQSDFEWEWSSNDVSYCHIVLGPGAEFEWHNPDGSWFRLTGGTGGATVTLYDHKTKSGIVIVPGSLVPMLLDDSYGTHPGEPLLALGGYVGGGQAEFVMELEGFVGLPPGQTVLEFPATLVAYLPNPVTLLVNGQGDQLSPQFLQPGTLTYSTRWESDAVFDVGGYQMVIGDFYLDSYGSPSEFTYGIAGDLSSASARFTIGERYKFVHMIEEDPTGFNLRQVMDGWVTKDLSGPITEIPTPVQRMSWGAVKEVFRE